MSDTMREIVSASAANNAKQKNALISLDIEDDKMFLLHFIIGTYFGPDLRKHDHPKKQSAFQIQGSNLPTKDELSGSLMERVDVESVYHHILKKNADPSLTVKPRTLRQYFNGKRFDSVGTFPLFVDLFPRKLHPESRVGNEDKVIKSIVFINDPDTSCMTGDCVDRFKQLTGLQSFTLSLNIEKTVSSSAEDEIDESLEPSTRAGIDSEENNVGATAKPEIYVSGAICGPEAGSAMGLMDIGECDDAYLFRIALPGVNRDERDFSCEVEDDGKVLVRGVTTTGEKKVHRYSQVFEMQTQNLCPPGNFFVSFRLPGPVHPQEFTGNFGTDGIFEGIVLKKL